MNPIAPLDAGLTGAAADPGGRVPDGGEVVVQARRSTAAAETRLRLAVATAALGLVEWDIARGTLRLDARASANTAGILPPDRWLAMDGPERAAWRAAIHPEDLPRREAIQMALLTGQAEAREDSYRFRAPGDPPGEWRWIASTAAVEERDPLSGRPLRLLHVTRDATARRRAEARLHAALAELQGIYDSAPVGLCVLDRDMRWTRINARLAEMNGLPAQAHLGRSVRELLPDLAGAAEALHRRVVESGEALHGIEITGATPAQPGVTRVWEESWLPLRDPEGRVVGVNVVAEEVTERRAIAAVREEEVGRFRALAEAMPGIAWEATEEGRIVWVSRTWSTFTGRPEAGPGGAPDCEGVIHPEDLPRSRAAWRAAVAAGTGFEVEQRGLRHDGAWRWFLSRAMPQTDAAGRALRWLGVSTEIHDLVAAREALARDNAALEALVEDRTAALRDTVRRLEAEQRRREADQAALLQAQKLEALGQLVGGVAHDFNNLLMAISGSFQMLERRLPAETADDRFSARDLLRQGQDAAGRAGTLVRQMLGFARRQPLSPAPLDPQALAEPLAAMLRPAIGPRAVLNLAIAPDAGPVLVDRQQLEVALLNLGVNARDAMPEGGHVTLGIANLREDGHDWVAFTLADTGAGMPPEVLARAREPFFTTKGVGKGTGLGLAMVHGFAEQSGGALRLDSTPGQGTRVTILLPRLTEAGALLAGARGNGAPAMLDRTRHGGARILLVEDDAAVRPITASFLRDLGYGVVEAPDAAAGYALAVADEGGVDLMVTDVMMPGEDGMTLAARVARERPDLPVLFITGHAERKGLAPGAAVLDKPFTQEALAGRVLERLGRRAPPPDAAGNAAGGAPQDPIARRIRGAGARSLYAAWREILAATGGTRLPPPGMLLGEPWGARPRGRMLLVAVDHGGDPPGLRRIAAGPALEAAMGRPLTEADLFSDACDEAGNLPGDVADSYRACAVTARPVYDVARFGRLEAGAPPVLFERLLLPCSDAGGMRATHIVSMVFISDPEIAA